jgi:hypothetical protein
MTLDDENPLAINAAPDAATSAERQQPANRKLTGDVSASIVLVIVSVFSSFVASTAGFTLVMTSSACNEACNEVLFSGGVLFASFAPGIITIIGVIVTIVRVVRRKRAFWVPLVVMGAQLLAFLIGFVVVYGGLGAF